MAVQLGRMGVPYRLYDRRTEIVGAIEGISNEDLIVEEDMVVTLSHLGYIKRLPVSTYRKQRRGGRGVFDRDAA